MLDRSMAVDRLVAKLRDDPRLAGHLVDGGLFWPEEGEEIHGRIFFLSLRRARVIRSRRPPSLRKACSRLRIC